MIGALIGIIGAILSIVEINLRRKYLDQYLNLERSYREETNRPISERDDAAIDNIEFELRVLARAITSDIGKQNPAPVT